MTLLLIFCITFFFTITTQQGTVTDVNVTNVFDILEAIQRLTEEEDENILLLDEEKPSRNTNKTTILYDGDSDYEESENDEENKEDINYLNEQNDTQSPKMKNILRWLPKKKRSKVNKQARDARAAEKEEKSKVRAQNAARVAEILSVIRTNQLASSFMYKEVKRIQSDRTIIDDMREMILRVERSKVNGYKQSVLNCFMKQKTLFEAKEVGRLWGQPNNYGVINVVKDTLNDGVAG